MSPNPELANLTAQIADLETRLADLRAKRDALVDRSHPEKERWQLGDPVIINDEAEMTLAGIPDFVRVVLDALPVSVFLKKAQVVSDRGRKFTYINAKARSKLKWSEFEVTEKFDSQAFAGEWDSIDYKKMLKQETETIDGRRSRLTELLWTPEDAPWRLAPTIEIPIFGVGDPNTPIGFCAIAREDDFEKEARFLSWVRSVFHHEYFNWVSRPIQNATRHTSKTVSATLATLRDHLTKHPDVEQSLVALDERIRHVKQQSATYSNTVEAIYSALEPIALSSKGSVHDILDKVKNIFGESSVLLEIESRPETSARILKRPAATIGIVTALILNALKHSTEQDGAKLGSRKPVRLIVTQAESEIRFSVRNRGVVKGGLNIETFDEREERKGNMTDNLSGIIMGEILLRSFLLTREKRIAAVTQPTPIDGEWVDVTYVHTIPQS